jgi:hypothetical protein
MTPDLGRSLGYVTMIGGGLGLLLAPIMVIIKYATGWAVIPEPSWVGIAQSALGGLFRFATPAELWMVYGSGYTIALVLMTIGFAGLFTRIRAPDGRLLTKGVWVVLAGFSLVIPGDASGALWWYSATMAACGMMAATGRGHRLTVTPRSLAPGSPPAMEGGRG